MPRFLRFVAGPSGATARWIADVSTRHALFGRWVARGTAWGILGYRKILSPIKGYRCAHAALTGGPSCSDVALVAFQNGSFSEALRITELQFADCRRLYMDGLPDAVEHALRMLPDLSDGSGLGVQICGDGTGCCPFGDDPRPP